MFDDEAPTLAPENRLTSQPTTAIGGSLDGQAAAYQLPANIGRYRIIRLLGEGGMGAVYEAEQDQPRRRVALKVIKAAWASPELLHRFEQEFQTLGRFHHPGIAQIYEAGTADTGFGFQPFFAMELINGKPLGAYAGAEHLNTRQRLALMIQICEAVQHAHQHGIIHRDLKPGNILVDETGQPKILDFGLSRATDSDVEATRQTDMGQLLGTLPYMSPEQVTGDPLAIDTRSDVYALGVILYELLAGKLPYLLSHQLHEAVRTIQQSDPAPLSSIDRTYRGDIETIVAKALEKDKARRYASAADLAGDIRRYLDDQPIMAKPASTSYHLQKFARRHKALVVGVAAVFMALLLGIVASTWEAVQARRAERKAQQESAIAQAVNDFLQNDILGRASAYNQYGSDTKPDPDLKVRTALNRAAGNIPGKFDKQPEVEAAIRSTIGRTYDDLGLFPEARKQLERTLELDRRMLGPENPSTIETMIRLGKIERSQGDSPEAEALLGQALQTSRHVLGPEHPDTLLAMNGLAGVYRDRGKQKEAEALDSRTLETRSRVLGENHPDTLISMNSLANDYYAEGRYSEAETLYGKTLEIRRRVLGPEHPLVFDTMMNLALAYFNEGKYPQAEALGRQTLGIERSVLGPEHPNTLLAMSNLAADYNYQGKYEEAAALDSQTLEVRRRVLGTENPDTLDSMNNLALDNYGEGNYAKAEALDTQVSEIRRRVLGPEHPNTLLAMSNLANVYCSEARYAQAEALQSRTLEVRRRVLGPEHPDTLESMNSLGEILNAEERHAQAEGLQIQALEIQRRVLGPEHPDTLSTMNDLGGVYLSQGKYAQAEAPLTQALTGRRHALGEESPGTMASAADLALSYLSQRKLTQGEPLAREALETDKRIQPDNWQRYRAASLLGASLAGEKKYAEAEPLLLEGYRGMLARKEKIDAYDLYHLDLARKWIIQLYQAWGKPEKAAEWKPK